MKLLKKWTPFTIAAIFVLALIIVPAAAELKSTQTDDGKTLISNGTYWIAFDPIGDHTVGDQFFVNGTTNFSTGSHLSYSFFTPYDNCRTKICKGKSPGTGGNIILFPNPINRINTFSLLINTTDLQSNQFSFSFFLDSSDNPPAVDAFNKDVFVDTTIFLMPEDLRKTIADSRTTHPDTNNSYWLSVGDMVEYTRPCYSLIGTTNLPPEEFLSYSFLDPATGGRSTPQRNGVVIPGEKPGINRFVIPINTSNLTEWVYIIIWNPRYNASVPSDSLSISTDFRPSPDVKNISTTCLVTPPIITPASPLSLIVTSGAIIGVFLFICLSKEKKRKNDQGD